MRTIVDLPEQIRKLALVCRREKISRAEAVRRALDRFFRSTSVRDSGHSLARPDAQECFPDVARLRREWSRRSECAAGQRHSARFSRWPRGRGPGKSALSRVLRQYHLMDGNIGRRTDSSG